ncbi:MAG: diguanylate cyclase, partial [Deltaproteobacteria bacterium]
MLAYILKRLLGMVPLFFGITIVSFLVIHLAPGSPISVQTDLNPKMTAEARERLLAFYGLDK